MQWATLRGYIIEKLNGYGPQPWRVWWKVEEDNKRERKGIHGFNFLRSKEIIGKSIELHFKVSPLE